ncbi:hypothetical protein [Thermococcus sp.]
MSKKFIAITILFLLSQSVAASNIVGWFSVPQTVVIGNYTISLNDISGTDGRLFLSISNESHEKEIVLNAGSYAELGNLRVILHKSIAGERGFVYLNITYPILFVGENLKIGEYEIRLVNAGLSKEKPVFKLTISNGSSTKDFTKSPITFGNLKLTVSPYPKIFSGYIKINQSIEFYGHKILFKDITIENTSSGYVEIVTFESDGVEKSIEVGKDEDIGIFHVVTKDLIGDEYLLCDIYVRGAYINVEILPDFTKKVYEGKEITIAPYLIRVDKILGNSVYLTIRNSCGEILSKGFLYIGNFTSMLYYKGIGVWLDSIGSDANGNYAQIVGYTYPSELPKISKMSVLDVSFIPLTNTSIQYAPFKTKIVVKNIGDFTVRNIYVKYTPPKGIDVIGDNMFYINNLTVGSKKEFIINLRSNLTGKVSLGKIEVMADVPYELACGGYKTITFYSNSPFISIIKADVNYSITIKAPEYVQAGKPFNVTLTVKNIGNVNVPILLKIPLKHFGVINGGNLRYTDTMLYDAISLNPNESKIYSFTLVPIDVGYLNITAVAVFKGRVVREYTTKLKSATHSTIETTTVTVTKMNNTKETVVSTISKTITTTIIKKETKTLTETETVEIITLKSKILWWIIGLIIGAGVIILIAWIQAKRS